MTESKDLRLTTSWNISKLNSLGSDLENIVEVITISKASTSTEPEEPETFLNIVNMDNCIQLERPPAPETTDDKNCQIFLQTKECHIAKICIVCDVKNMEIFTGNSSELCSYWRTFKGGVVDELSEMGFETYMHEIEVDHVAKSIELKVDFSIFLFSTKNLVFSEFQFFFFKFLAWKII